ncbi:hypothetical protein CsSME_00051532 [Camellia sinensis var. sinensis]
MNKKLIAIVQLVGNSEGKTRIVDLGLDEIKERVIKEESGDGSNLPCSTKSPIHTGSTQGGTSRKVISPLVARRRGRPVTKRKVAKVDQIVNRLLSCFDLKLKLKLKHIHHIFLIWLAQKIVAHSIGGTSLTPSDFISGTQGSLMSAPTQICGSASLTPSASHACTPGSLDITDLFD